MAIGSFMSQRTPATSPVMDAQRLPTDFPGLVSSSYDNGMRNNRITSERSGIREAQDEQYEPMLARAESELPEFNRSGIIQRAQQYYLLKKSKALGDRYATNDTEARYAAMVDTFEPLGWEVPLYSNTEATAAERATKAYDQLQEDLQYSVTNSPKWAMFFGEAGSAFSDPAQLAAMIASTPLAMTTNIIRSAAVEGAINLAIDAPLLYQQKQWYAKQGRELTNDEIATQLIFSFGLGAGIGGVLSGGYRLAGGQETKMLNPDFLSADMLAANKVRGTGSMNSSGRFYNEQLPMGWETSSRDYRGTTRPEWMTEAESAQARFDANVIRRGQEAYDSSADAVTGPYPSDDIHVVYDVETASSDATNPFKQTLDDAGVTATLYKEAKDIHVPSVTQGVSEIADSSRHFAYHPYRGTQWAPHDQFTTKWNKPELDKMHAENMKAAVLALYDNTSITVPQRSALTVALTIDDTAGRLADLTELAAGKITLSMRVKAYRDFIRGKIQEVMIPRLQKQVDAMKSQFPENGEALVPQVARPKSSEEVRIKREAALAEQEGKSLAEREKYASEKEASISERAKKADDAQKKATTERKAKFMVEQKALTAARTQLKADRKAAAKFGKEWAKAKEEGRTIRQPKGIRTVDQLDAAEAALDKKAATLAEKRAALTASDAEATQKRQATLSEERAAIATKTAADAEASAALLAKKKNQLADENAQQIDYDDEVVRVSNINDAMKAEKALKDLQAGKIPYSLVPMQNRLNAHYQALKDSPSLRAEAMNAGAARRIDDMFGGEMSVKEAMSMSSRNVIATPVQEKAIVDAMFIELEARDVKMEFMVPNADGINVRTTLGQQLDEVAAVDNAVEAMGVCGL